MRKYPKYMYTHYAYNVYVGSVGKFFNIVIFCWKYGITKACYYYSKISPV